MATSYRIEPSLDCIFVTLADTVTDVELIEGQKRMFRDEYFVGRYSRLIDATKVTRLLVTADTVRGVARAAVDRGARRAALVASSDFVYAMMRMYEGYAIDAECWVGRDVNEALAWLLGKKQSG